VEEGNQNHASTRILALDLGKRRIGLAISDPLGVTAQGLDTLERANIRADIAELAGLITAKGVSLILMGKPLHMSGQEGRQVAWTRDFAERLNRATGVPVEFRDERLTTVQAERVLREGGVRLRKDRARSVDRLSAVLILQDYLDSRHV
jgi:putative Holliday junction resolvase